MVSKAFNASWILLLIVGLIAALGGATMILYPQFFLANEIENYVGQTWSSLETANQRLFSYFLHDVRLLGFMQFTTALVMILIVILYYRKLDKPSWYICLGINTVALGSSMALNIPIGGIFVNIFLGSLMVLGYIALALGATTILKSKAG